MELFVIAIAVLLIIYAVSSVFQRNAVPKPSTRGYATAEKRKQ